MREEQTKFSLSRRQFLVNSAAAAALLGLVACAPGATDTGGGEAPAAAAPAEPAAEPTVAIGEYGSGGDPVVLWHGLGGADGATFAVMLEDYATNNEAPVRSETYGWDVFFQKFPTAVAAGTPPDMAIFHAAEVPQMTDQGLIMPVDDVFFSTGRLPKDDFTPAIMNTVTIDGNTMVVPFDTHGWNMYVNTELVKAAGGDPENLPANGAEFLDLALKITTDKNGKHPGEDGFDVDNVAVWAWHQSWNRFTYPSLLGMFGGAIFDAESNTATLNSEENVQALQYAYDLYYTHMVAPAPLPGLPGPYDFFKTNSQAFMWDGTWSLNFFKDNPDIEKITIGAPLSSFAPDGKIVQKIDAHIMALPVGIDDAALERSSNLIEWLSNSGKTWATSGQIPARTSVQQDPEVQAIWSVKSAAENFAKYGKTDVPHKAFIEIQTAWEAAIGAAMSQTTPLQQALDEGNATIQAILDRG
ncbi:MAG: extracellular solute-binding protein [Caldilineaceae bacterium]|nr:extracellular solute-binding protein [Caldilineaceae bacterium]